jgi:hypothetical protein
VGDSFDLVRVETKTEQNQTRAPMTPVGTELGSLQVRSPFLLRTALSRATLPANPFSASSRLGPGFFSFSFSSFSLNIFLSGQGRNHHTHTSALTDWLMNLSHRIMYHQSNFRSPCTEKKLIKQSEVWAFP